jgi:pyridoxine 5-phosphate synthase
MVRLGVNIDHVATLREARRGKEPDPVTAASCCVHAGADSIVAHLREDRRHIKERDVYSLKRTIPIRLNLEMSINPGIVAIACRLKPDQATLVPEKRKELTTEGGLDIVTHRVKIALVVERLKRNRIEPSLFIDPQRNQIDAAARIGASLIELHTGRYADAASKQARLARLAQIKAAARYGSTLGLRVCAGHGLDYRNVQPIARIREIEELNIGYSIVCHALFVGMDNAVREMKTLIRKWGS